MLNYYVITFDTTKNYVTTFQVKNLTLPDAITVFDDTVKTHANHINVMLGVSYSVGAVDLLQRIDGKLKLSNDYQYSAVKDEIADAVATLQEKYNL